MKNLNLNEQEKQRGWHDFCSINHANQTEFQADTLSAFGRFAVSVTLEECPANNALRTRLSRANHALFPLSRCVNTLIRIGDYVVGGRARRGAGKEVVAMMRQKCMMWKYAAMVVLMLTIGVGEMWGERRIYLHPTSVWNAGKAKFSIHYWADDHAAENQWMIADSDNDDFYYYDVPDWVTKVIFIRNTNVAASPGFGEKWAQTVDLDIPTRSACYKITNYDGGKDGNSYGNWQNAFLKTKTVYFEANNTGWQTTESSGPYFRIGKDATSAGSTATWQTTKVDNTSNLYKHTRSGAAYEDYLGFCLTDAAGWANDNSIYQTGGLKWRTEVNVLPIVTDVTIIPRTSSHDVDYADKHIYEYYTELYQEGLLTYTLTQSHTGNGVLTINAPIDGNGTMNAFANVNGYTVPTANIRIEPTPADGYELTRLIYNQGGGDNELKNDENYGYTFYYNNVRANATITATFTKIEEKKIYIYDSGNWSATSGKLCIHAWNETLKSDNGYGNFGPELKSLGNNWYEATLSTAFTHFMISDGSNSHKSSDRAIADYTDGGCYQTSTGDIPSYGQEPNIVYVKVTKGGDSWSSNTVTAANETLSFFYPDGATADLYYFESGIQHVALTTDFSAVKDHVITAKWNGNETATALETPAVYEGDYYIHVYANTRNYLENGEPKGGVGNKFTKFEKNSSLGDTYSYYWVDWFLEDGQTGGGVQSVAATVGNDYNDNLAGILGANAEAPTAKTTSAGANVRYGYDPETNYFTRAMITGNGTDVKIKAAASGKVSVGGNDAYSEARSFNDATNWVYTVDATIKGKAEALVETTYNGHKQILRANHALMGGNEGDSYNVTLSYDLKTNRVVAAWVPGATIAGFSLQSNLMVERTADGNPTILNITTANTDLSDITQIYTVIKFNQADWASNANSTHRIIDGSYTDEYYWISLPYDCNVADIFGISNYGSNGNWVIQTYHGDYRAQQGWWAETDSWWYDLDRTDKMLANQGYVLRVTNLDDVFPGASTTLRLYFPSSNDAALRVGHLTTTAQKQTRATAHPCNIWRGQENTPQTNEGNPNYDRRAIDSNWNIIGSPSFNTAKIIDGDWGEKPYPANPTGTLKYFYEWTVDGGKPKYTITDAENYSFPATHAYLVQYAGPINWAASETPGEPLVGVKAPARDQEEQGDQTLKLVLNKDGEQADVTYISRMAEGATEGYDLNLDLSKLLSNSGNNLYTLAGYYKMAGNCLPETTTTVSVGVQIAAEGEYTFSMPEGTNGTGAVLIDHIAGTRTNLALTDYTVQLPAGQTDNRFVLELSPISNVATGDLTPTLSQGEGEKAHKALIDGVLYIVKDGQVFDARGNKVK